MIDFIFISVSFYNFYTGQVSMCMIDLRAELSWLTKEELKIYDNLIESDIWNISVKGKVW